jgi:hypothetical protein
VPGLKVHEGADEVETIGSENGNKNLLEGGIVFD